MFSGGCIASGVCLTVPPHGTLHNTSLIESGSRNKCARLGEAFSCQSLPVFMVFHFPVVVCGTSTAPEMKAAPEATLYETFTLCSRNTSHRPSLKVDRLASNQREGPKRNWFSIGSYWPVEFPKAVDLICTYLLALKRRFWNCGYVP